MQVMDMDNLESFQSGPHGSYESQRPEASGPGTPGRALATPPPDGVPFFRDRVIVNRLIVLVPERGIEGNELARRIWALAAPCELKVVFLCALGADTDGSSEREPAMRLRLATLASLIRDERVDVSWQVMTGWGWVQAVRDAWQPGDLVLCYAEHRIPTQWWGRQPLGQILASVLDLPVYVLTGMDEAAGQTPVRHSPTASFRSTLVYWAGVVTLLAGFFLAQVQIDQLAAGFAHTVLFVMAALMELGLIVLWTARQK
jgi:hypothetical protein